MAKAANYPLNIRIGDTETVTVTMQDNDCNPINIVGRTYSAQIREKPSSTTILGSFTCSVIDGANGKFACVLSAATTAGFSEMKAFWDLQENNSGTITTLMAGEVLITRDVTR